MMRIIHLIILFSVTWYSSMAFATNWQLIIDEPPVKLEIDADSLVTKNGFSEAKFRFNHLLKQKSANGNLYQSSEVTSLFNCEGKKYAPYKRVEFEESNSTGKEVNRLVREGTVIAFYDPAPGSMGEIMFERVCTKK